MSKALIHSERLSIVLLTSEMIYDVWQNSLDDNNRQFVPDEVFETLEDAKEVVESLIDCYQNDEGPFVYAVIRNNDNANLGYVQLVKIDDGWEIGYHIAQKYTNNGYATEAVRLFLEYLKNKGGIKEIYGIALYDNVASKKVLQKCGFTTIYEGMGNYQGNDRKIIKTVKKL